MGKTSSTVLADEEIKPRKRCRSDAESVELSDQTASSSGERVRIVSLSGWTMAHLSLSKASSWLYGPALILLLDKALGSLSHSLSQIWSPLVSGGVHAPITLMSQTGQSAIDRDAAEHDHDVNRSRTGNRASTPESWILLREEEIGRLIQIHRAAGSPLVQQPYVRF